MAGAVVSSLQACERRLWQRAEAAEARALCPKLSESHETQGGGLSLAQGAHPGVPGDDPEGCSGHEVGGRGHVCILTADSHCCMAETTTIL